MNSRLSSGFVFRFCLAAAFFVLLPPANAAEVQSGDSPSTAGARNPHWAVSLEKPGLPNFFKINDMLYRGAQPTAEGMRELKAMGVKTVLNLRSFHSDLDEIGDTELGYEHVYAKAWHPEDEDVVRFLKIVANKSRQPVFVHCQHGADRTGLMCAIYRVAVDGWSKEEAIEEMTRGGYGYHEIWSNLIDYLNMLDIDKIKAEAGLKPEDVQ